MKKACTRQMKKAWRAKHRGGSAAILSRITMHITTTSQPPPPTRHHHHCYHHNYHQRVLVRACACTACYSRAVTPALRPVRAFGGGVSGGGWWLVVVVVLWW